ncbi:MAG TPA: hypothetical protein DIU07_06830 [Rhodobacteraceae bacterium]|nr:hypothetical protein [Paracoccaceae bacterium]
MATPGIWGDEFLVNGVTASAQMTPVITALAGGRFAIAYTDFSKASFDGFTDHSDSAIRVQVFSSDGTALSSVVQVNTVTTFYQKSPRIAPLADGGFVVTYSDLSIGWDSGGDDIWADAVRMQRFTGDADKLGAETLVNTTLYGDQDYPSIALLENGQFVIAWDDGYWDVDENISAQLFNPNGSFAGDELMVNAGTAGSQTGSDIAALPGGGYVVTWVDATGVDGDVGTIMARMFNADGSPAAAEFQVNATGAGDQYQPSITALAGGGFFIAWTDNSRGVDTGADDTSSYAIRGQVFDAEGDWVGSEFRVNLVTTNGQVQPDVLALADGRFIVAYSDTSQGVETDGDDTDIGAIRARIYNPDGSPDGDEFLVNVTTDGHQNEPQMAQLPDGRVVFTWSDYSYGVATDGDDPSNGAIRARILDLRETPANWVGSAGDDDFTGTSWNDALSGADGNDNLMGADGDDTLTGKRGDDSLAGGLGDDLVKGGGGRDTLRGDKGADHLFGGSGDDVLLGDYGADRIQGNSGEDEITGGRGRDLITGGKGADTFVFTDAEDSRPGSKKRDTITDFEDGIDKLDFSAIDADSATAWNDPLRFLGHAEFTGTPGEIRYSHGSESSMIKIDLDGDKSPDMKIKLTDWHQLEASDFIL